MQKPVDTLERYDRFIKEVARSRFDDVRGFEIENFERVGRLCTATLIDKGYSDDYIRTAIKNSMLSLCKWQKRRKRILQKDLFEKALSKLHESLPAGKYQYRVNPAAVDEIALVLEQYDLTELCEYGLSREDINILIDKDILIGERVTRGRMAGATLRRRYREDSGFRKHMKTAHRQSIQNARRAYSKLLEDPKYRARVKETKAESAARASEVFRKKMKNDPNFHEEFCQATSESIEKAREKLAENCADPEYEARLKKAHAEGMRKTRKIFSEKLETDPEFRKTMVPKLRKNAAKASKKVAENRLEKSEPRRIALRDQIITPEFGNPNNACTSKVVELLDAEEYGEIRRLYPENPYYVVRRDIRFLRCEMKTSITRK